MTAYLDRATCWSCANLEVAYAPRRPCAASRWTVHRGELLCVVWPQRCRQDHGSSIRWPACSARSAERLAIDGRDLMAMPPHRFCGEGIALVPEGRRLFTGMTVRENLELGSFLPKAKARRQRSMDDALVLFPALRAKLASPAGELSGGQQQMVAIARALWPVPAAIVGRALAGCRRWFLADVRRDRAHQRRRHDVCCRAECRHGDGRLPPAYVLEEGAIVPRAIPSR